MNTLNLFDHVASLELDSGRSTAGGPAVTEEAASSATEFLESLVAEVHDPLYTSEVKELASLLRQPHTAALLATHDVVASEIYGNDAVRVTPNQSSPALEQDANISGTQPSARLGQFRGQGCVGGFFVLVSCRTDKSYSIPIKHVFQFLGFLPVALATQVARKCPQLKRRWKT